VTFSPFRFFLLHPYFNQGLTRTAEHTSTPYPLFSIRKAISQPSVGCFARVVRMAGRKVHACESIIGWRCLLV